MNRKKPVFQNEEMLRLTQFSIEQANEGFMWSDKNGRIILANKKACIQLGYRKEEIIKLSVFDFDPNITKKDWKKHWKELQEKKAITIESIHKKKDGSIFPVGITLTYVMIGNKEYNFAIIRDITEGKKTERKIKENEEKLRAIYEKVSEGVLIVSRNTMKIVEANPGFTKISGYSVKELENKTIELIHPKKELSKIVNLFKKAKAEQIKFTENIPVKRKDKKIIYCDISSKVIETSKEKLIVGVFRDMTEKKIKQDELLESKIIIKKEVEKKTKELQVAYEKIKEYSKRLGYKINRIQEKKIRLTNKEKIGLYGLIKYSYLTDKEIATIMKLPTTTLNTIKNRLIKEKYLKIIYLPKIDLIENNMISIVYATINTKSRISLPHIMKNVVDIPEKVFICNSSRNGFSIDVSNTWYDFKKNEDNLNRIFIKKNILFENYNIVHFISKEDEIQKFFEFKDIIKERFELNIEEQDINVQKEKKRLKTDYLLSKNEKKVILGLLQYPYLALHRLSKNIGLSAPTIAKIKNRLIDNSIIRKTYVPNPLKIDMELILLSHHKLDYSNHEEICKQTHKNDFFSIASNTDHITLSLHKDYQSIHDYINTCPICNKKNYLEKPTKMIIPIENNNSIRLELIPLIKKIFKI